MPKKQKRNKIWVRKFSSFEEAEEFDNERYATMTPKERLDIMQYLRETYHKFKKGRHAHRKGLRRVIKILQQA